MKNKIMILGASILQLPAIQKAKKMGLSVVVVDMNPDAVGFKEEGIEREIISTIDATAVLRAAKKHSINGILTLASDMPMRTVAKVSKELGLVGISEETALKATDKVIMREALRDHNVSVPIFYKVTNEEEFFDAVYKIRTRGYKCIVKPSDNSGSRGVELLKNFRSETLKKAYSYSKSYSRSGEVIVEEYMDGPEVSVEAIAIDGVCHVIQITDKLTTGAPYFVEMGHSQPSMLSETILEKVEYTAKAANEAIGIINGPSHAEIKVTADGPKIVEIGARLGGDNITTHLVPLSTGIDMIECCINIALGRAIKIQKKWNKGSAIRYLHLPIGTVRSVKGIDKLDTSPGIIQTCVTIKKGQVIDTITNSTERVGFVISQDDNAQKAILDCEKALSLIDVEIDKTYN
nr:ATP-grasp domain-containing protein [Lachnoclostridium phocaeense]